MRVANKTEARTYKLEQENLGVSVLVIYSGSAFQSNYPNAKHFPGRTCVYGIVKVILLMIATYISFKVVM